MSRTRRGLDPAWLNRPGRGQGHGPGPDGPELGEVYDVDSDFPGFRDVHRDNLRPSVVVRLDASANLVNLLTRTSKLHVDGVKHPETPEWGLDLPGKFGKEPVQSLDVRLFSYPLVDFLGVLDETTWDAVLTMWESS